MPVHSPLGPPRVSTSNYGKLHVFISVIVLLNYLTIHSVSDGPLFVFQDGTLLLRDRFVCEVKEALDIAGVDSKSYPGHSFRIGAATAAAKAGVPAFTIKMLGR